MTSVHAGHKVSECRLWECQEGGGRGKDVTSGGWARGLSEEVTWGLRPEEGPAPRRSVGTVILAEDQEVKGPTGNQPPWELEEQREGQGIWTQWRGEGD